MSKCDVCGSTAIDHTEKACKANRERVSIKPKQKIEGGPSINELLEAFAHKPFCGCRGCGDSRYWGRWA